jgi:transposase
MHNPITPSTDSTQPHQNSSVLPCDLKDFKVASLPIVAHFLQKLGITALIDREIPSPQNISSGQVVAAMVMDTLTGRNPLYKLHEFFNGQDTALLFGRDLAPEDFNDNNLGKVLDNIHAYGAGKLFSQVSWQACQRYDLQMRYLHYNTTSVNVHGDYDAYAQKSEETIAITYGHSKDKRPDMKQFMIEALCVEGGVPLLGSVLSGNTSDKKANNVELTRVASYLKKNGLDPAAFIYLADSALVTEENLEALQGQLFITRLPANYKAEQEAIEAAVEAGKWLDVGPLAELIDPSKNRLSARYKLAESSVELHGRTYRAIVVYSSSHDKRRARKLDKQLAQEKEAFAKLAKATLREPLACAVDARQRAEALIRENHFAYHQMQAEIVAEPIYAPGRPKTGQQRQVRGHRHRIHLKLIENTALIARARELAGCFVLLSNVPNADEPEGLSAKKMQTPTVPDCQRTPHN